MRMCTVSVDAMFMAHALLQIKFCSHFFTVGKVFQDIVSACASRYLRSLRSPSALGGWVCVFEARRARATHTAMLTRKVKACVVLNVRLKRNTALINCASDAIKVFDHIKKQIKGRK